MASRAVQASRSRADDGEMAKSRVLSSPDLSRCSHFLRRSSRPPVSSPDASQVASEAPQALTPMIPVELFGVPRLLVGDRVVDRRGGDAGRIGRRTWYAANRSSPAGCSTRNRLAARRLQLRRRRAIHARSDAMPRSTRTRCSWWRARPAVNVWTLAIGGVHGRLLAGRAAHVRHGLGEPLPPEDLSRRHRRDRAGQPAPALSLSTRAPIRSVPPIR